jgi:hypothetical protein
MTCSEAAKLGNDKRREPIRATARRICLELGLPIPDALNPPLTLSRADRIGA